jgi:hypothetical protein
MSTNGPRFSPKQHRDTPPGSIWLHVLTPILRVVVGVPICVLWVLWVSHAARIFEEFDVELPGLSVFVLRAALYWARMWPLGIPLIAVLMTADFAICLILKSHRFRVIWEVLAWLTPVMVFLMTLVAVGLPLLSLVQNLS